MLSDSDKNIVVNTLRNSAVTQESIQSASRTLAKYSNCAKEVVQLWQEEIYNADEAKILPLMYIANDVIQTTKRTGPNYVDAFLGCMKACLRVCVAINSKVVSKLKRITKVWGDRHIYPRAVITKLNGAFNENDMDHDGTPNSTPDPSLLVKINSGSPAYTPSPIFSDEEADDEATKDGSGSKATSGSASGTHDELDSKNENNEDAPYKSTVASALHNYHSEIELGNILYRRVNDIDMRQYSTNFMLNQVGNFQISPQATKDRIKEVARMVKQYQGHLKSRTDQRQQIMQSITSDIKYLESEISTLDEQMSELEDSKEYLKEIQEQNDNQAVLILRKKRKKTTEMLRDEKNPKLDFGDDDLNVDKKNNGESSKGNGTLGSSTKKKKKKQAMIWDNVQKMMVPLYSNEDWRDH